MMMMSHARVHVQSASGSACVCMCVTSASHTDSDSPGSDHSDWAASDERVRESGHLTQRSKVADHRNPFSTRPKPQLDNCSFRDSAEQQEAEIFNLIPSHGFADPTPAGERERERGAAVGQ